MIYLIWVCGGGGVDYAYNTLLVAAKKSLGFQNVYFKNKKHFLPLEILIASCVIYNRLKKIKPNFETIFEIGPGSSGMSYFLSQHEYLKDYSYTDACESFYMLQNLINTYCFYGKFENKALDIQEEIFFDPPSHSKSILSRQQRNFIDSDNEVVANAYPWWKINEVAKKKKYFDIVLSNANLQEFSNDSLHDYLLLTKDILKDDGILYANCLGLASNNTPESLFAMIEELGFAVYFYYSYNNIFYSNLDKVNSYHNQDVVLVPTCESVKYLLQDIHFTARFKNIYLLDDFKSGRIGKYEIISTKQLENRGLHNLIFVDDKKELEVKFKERFNKKDFNFISLDCRRSVVPSLCLIKETHKDYKKYKQRTINFYKMPSGIEDIDSLYLETHNIERFDVVDKLKRDLERK